MVKWKTDAAANAYLELRDIAVEVLAEAIIALGKMDGVKYLASFLEVRNTYQKMIARAYVEAMKVEANGLAAGAVAASLLRD